MNSSPKALKHVAVAKTQAVLKGLISNKDSQLSILTWDKAFGLSTSIHSPTASQDNEEARASLSLMFF